MKDVWKMYVGLFLLVPLLAFGGINTYGGYKVEEVTSHIKMAAFAPNLEVMHEEIGKAIEAAANNGYTEGYTSVFKKTEDENVGTWFTRLNHLYSRLSDGEEVVYDQEIGFSGEPIAVRSKAVHLSLTSSSMVMQEVRGALVTPDGSARMPDGMWRFPNNTGMAWLFIVGLPAFLAGAFTLIVKLSS